MGADNVVNLRTPGGGSSSISVSRTDKGVAIYFVRVIAEGMPDVRSELLVKLAAPQARELAEAILKAISP